MDFIHTPMQFDGLFILAGIAVVYVLAGCAIVGLVLRLFR